MHPQSLGAWLARQPSGGPLALLSCGPIALAADLLRQHPDIRHAVCISTSSVYSKIGSPAAGERALIESIVAAERVVREHCIRHGVPLVILRPTLIYGCGLDRNVSRLAGWIRRVPVMPLAGAASGLRQPLHAGDLADLAVRALRYQSSEPLESPVCGGETLSYREMVRRIFTALDRTPRTVAVPPRLLNLALRVASGVGIVGEVNGQFIARQNLDLVFDDSPVRERFGFAPRPFRMTPADLAVPADVRTWLPDGGPEGDPPTSVG